MKQLWLSLASWLVLGSLPLSDARAQQRSTVRVALPGTIEPVILGHIGPAFTAATGYPLELSRAPSIALTNRIVSGELKPDVYISSDANQMKLLFGPAENERARWSMAILRSRTALLYSPRSRFADDFEAARTGRLAWYDVLRHPGLVLKRPDPTVDSGGYRAIFVFELAEKHYRIPGLKQQIIGIDNNESQYFDRTKDYPLLRNGSIDATVQFVTNASVGGVPYINLPEEVDQSGPALADWYATVRYTNPRGQTFQGAPHSMASPFLLLRRMRLELRRSCGSCFQSRRSTSWNAQDFCVPGSWPQATRTRFHYHCDRLSGSARGRDFCLLRYLNYQIYLVQQGFAA
jgi:molybdate/tungstate transport system substrate-binding protein